MSADGPRDSRCPPTKCREAAAAAATACRTSCRSDPGAVPGPPSCASAFAVRSISCPAANVAEVVRGQIREQRQSHVGRRGAMRDRGDRMLLIVVRRQPVVFRADEGFEERPGLARNLPEKKDLIGRQPRFAARERPADPPGDRGGGKPEEQYRPGHRQRGRLRCRQIDRRGRGDDGRDPHRPAGGEEAPCGSSRSGSPDGFHSSSRLRVTSIRPSVRTIASRLKNASYGQAGERKRRLSEVPAGRAQCRGEMLAAAAHRPASGTGPESRRSRAESG